MFDCLEHLFGRGVEAFVCDNALTDGTVEIVERIAAMCERRVRTAP
jgi:hypothetical protein